MSLTLESVRNRNVLLKVAYDLPSLNDTARIEASLETLHTLLKNRNRVLILTHWGRPHGFDSNFSTERLLPSLTKLYKRRYQEKLSAQYLNQYEYFEEGNEQRLRRVLNLFKGSVVMLENTRFSAAEQSQDSLARQALATQYAVLADVVVNEAFALSHRTEATNTELLEKLPTVLGLAYTREVSALDRFGNPQTPFAVLLGGAKLHTKLPLLEHLLPRVDFALLAGQAAFPFLRASSTPLDLAQTPVETTHLNLVRTLWQKYSKKIVLPVDLTFDSKGVALDLGPESIARFQKILTASKTVFWNGPVGYYENPDFAAGTKRLAATLAKLTDTYTVVGGGDTVAAFTPARLAKIDHASMGGGATLHYLANL